jgi:magnesium transporter
MTEMEQKEKKENSGTETIITDSKINDPISVEALHQALITSDIDGIKKLGKENSDVNLAEALNTLTDNEVNIFFSVITDYDSLGEIFSYLSVETREYLCNNLPKKTLTNVLINVPTDDLADYVEDLAKSLRDKVLLALPTKRRQIVQKLARFSDDTIGSIMTTDYLSVPPDYTIKQVFDTIKEVGNTLETVQVIFVTDSNNILLGTQRLESLMFEDPNTKISAVMQKDFPYISPIADKEEAIPVCKKYDLPVLPVVSRKGDMLGIITFDDVLDVIEAENTEDVYKQGGVANMSTPYMQTKTIKLAQSYVIWLIILLVINTFSAMIISSFESSLMTLPILISFIPALADSCGDAGDQTTSSITRGLATGEIQMKDFFKVAGKEFLAGFLTALLVAVFNFGWVMMELNTPILNTTAEMEANLATYFGSTQNGYMIIASIVSLSFLFGITFAKLFGVILPMLAKLIHIDPAFMSGPLIASLMDILTLLVYFGTAAAIIDSIDPGLIAIATTTVVSII